MIGCNRISPQLGVGHNCGKWSTELSSSASFYTENDNFFGGNSSPLPVHLWFKFSF
jgi:hypothetical protein